MEIQEFIINWINEIASKFEGISMKYAIEKFTNFHIIEISPDSIESSEEFSKEALDFEFDFFDKFPNEDLLICEESIENDMSNIIYSKKNLKSHNHEHLVSIVLKPINYLDFTNENIDDIYSFNPNDDIWDIIEEIPNHQNNNHSNLASAA